MFAVSFQLLNCVLCPKICAVVVFQCGSLGFLSFQRTAESRDLIKRYRSPPFDQLYLQLFSDVSD